MEAATEERPSAEPEPRLVDQHPDNPEDYDASVEQKVETRQEHGTETDSEGDEYETLTTITRTLRKTTYRPKHSDAVWTEVKAARAELSACSAGANRAWRAPGGTASWGGCWSVPCEAAGCPRCRTQHGLTALEAGRSPSAHEECWMPTG